MVRPAGGRVMIDSGRAQSQRPDVIHPLWEMRIGICIYVTMGTGVPGGIRGKQAGVRGSRKSGAEGQRVSEKFIFLKMTWKEGIRECFFLS